MSNELHKTVNEVLISIGIAAGSVSFFDNVEQVGRIVLLLVSIISGIMFVMMNWDKWILSMKKNRKKKIKNEAKTHPKFR